MTKKLLFSLCFLMSLSFVAGCGNSSGPAEFDTSNAAAFTAEDEQAAADYEAQMAKEQEEQYGN